MSQYTDLVSDIAAITNRPLLTAEMKIGIRGAINKAHRAGNFPRDLVYSTLDIAAEQIQSIDFTAAPFARFRQLASVQAEGASSEYKIVDALDLFDVDGYARYDIAYTAGNIIHIKAGAPATRVTVGYWQRPLVDPIENINDWIVDEHRDFIVHWAAATVLGLVGENEIKTRIETLASEYYKDLISDALESGGR